MKHTPGPWHLTKSQDGIYHIDNTETQDGGGIAVIYDCDGNSEHNAKLIAVAPELLEAAKYAANCGERDGMPNNPGLIPAWAVRLRELIAKAAGRQP